MATETTDAPEVKSPATVAVTATLQDFASDADVGALIVTLCNFGSQVPRVAGTALVVDAGPTEYPAASNGQVTVNLWGNDVITPSGTYYCIAVANENGDMLQVNLYQFTGAGPFDLSTTPPIDPHIGVPSIQFATTDIFLITLTGPNQPGSAYNLTYPPFAGSLLGLYYNGNLLIPGLHYSISGQTVTLNFSTGIGDNLCAVYVATSPV